MTNRVQFVPDVILSFRAAKWSKMINDIRIGFSKSSFDRLRMTNKIKSITRRHPEPIAIGLPQAMVEGNVILSQRSAVEG